MFKHTCHGLSDRSKFFQGRPPRYQVSAAAAEVYQGDLRVSGNISWRVLPTIRDSASSGQVEADAPKSG